MIQREFDYFVGIFVTKKHAALCIVHKYYVLHSDNIFIIHCLFFLRISIVFLNEKKVL